MMYSSFSFASSLLLLSLTSVNSFSAIQHAKCHGSVSSPSSPSALEAIKAENVASWVAAGTSSALVGFTLATQVAFADITTLQQEEHVGTAYDYPTTLVAAGAYVPETGYDSMDLSMPAYRTDSLDDLITVPSKKAVDPAKLEKARALAEKKAAQAQEKAERAAAKAAKDAEKLAQKEQADAAKRAAKLARMSDEKRAIAEAQEAKRAAGSEKEGKGNPLSSMKRMYGL